MATVSEVRFARAGEVDIAYRVMGNGPIDVVMVAGWVSHLEVGCELPELERFNLRFADFARLITLDKRGVGLSDRTVGTPTLEERMEDVLAVLDAVGSERAAMVGWADGAAVLVMLAATYPHRVQALVLGTVTGKVLGGPDDSSGLAPAAVETLTNAVKSSWGEGTFLPMLAPSVAGDERIASWWRRYERCAATPNAAATALRAALEIDVRALLPTIRVPTLVINRRENFLLRPEAVRSFAEQIPGAKYVELPGSDSLPYIGDSEALVAEIEEFLTGTRSVADTDRALATVLFTDIVGSTERAKEMGDRRWRDLLASHHGIVRRLLPQYGGHEVDVAGDGFLVTFDGPARAVRCAVAIQEALRTIGIQVRAGVHTGEVEVRGGSVSGLAVHIGARVGAKAGGGEVLVTSTVKDLVLGSNIVFADAGAHTLKGIPDEWRLYRVVSL